MRFSRSGLTVISLCAALAAPSSGSFASTGRAAPSPPGSARPSSTLVHRVTYEGQTFTLRLSPVNLRAPPFAVLREGPDGRQTEVKPGSTRAFLGTVDGSTSAVAAAIKRRDGRVVGQVTLDRGGTLQFVGRRVVETDGLEQPTTFAWPSASEPSRNRTVGRGQIGRQTYRWDVAFDLDASYFLGDLGGRVDRAMDAVELTAVRLLSTYERDARLRPAIGRVVLRGSASGSPYPADAPADLSTIAEEWRDHQGPQRWDAVAHLQSHEGGGVAYVGTLGGASAVSKNGGGNNIYVIRHELGHVWGPSDNHTNGPEGQTIESGNDYARFDGTELLAILRTRAAVLADSPRVLSPVAATGVALPPYAALDLVRGARSGRTYRLDPVANDGDANGDRLRLRSVVARSHLGARLAVRDGRVTYRAPRVGSAQTLDWFRYVVADATGRTATGVTLVRVSP